MTTAHRTLRVAAVLVALFGLAGCGCGPFGLGPCGGFGGGPGGGFAGPGGGFGGGPGGGGGLGGGLR